jgi:hypothetical protein
MATDPLLTLRLPSIAAAAAQSAAARPTPDVDIPPTVPDQFRSGPQARHDEEYHHRSPGAGCNAGAKGGLGKRSEALVPGAELSRETVRKWIKTLSGGWFTGEPPSREGD